MAGLLQARPPQQPVERERPALGEVAVGRLGLVFLARPLADARAPVGHARRDLVGGDSRRRQAAIVLQFGGRLPVLPSRKCANARLQAASSANALPPNFSSVAWNAGMLSLKRPRLYSSHPDRYCASAAKREWGTARSPCGSRRSPRRRGPRATARARRETAPRPPCHRGTRAIDGAKQQGASAPGSPAACGTSSSQSGSHARRRARAAASRAASRAPRAPRPSGGPWTATRRASAGRPAGDAAIVRACRESGRGRRCGQA